MNISQQPISASLEAFLENIRLSRSKNTARTYQNALRVFCSSLEDHNFHPDHTPTDKLSENAISWFASSLKDYSPATEQLYLTAAKGFYEYLAAEQLAEINLPRLRLLIRQRARRTGQRLPQFPQENIDKIIEYAINLTYLPADDSKEKLRNLRDRAFLLTLADTGLRVHEACGLRRGDIDWREAKAIVIGKGNQEAVVRFSKRAIRALRDYINARSQIDGSTGRALTSLPLFARHDKGAGKKTKPITTATGRNIVKQRVIEAIGEAAVGTITPHSFRHYFVTAVLRGSGGNLKLAQEMARHKNITVTQRYAHLSDDELDRSYTEIFDS